MESDWQPVCRTKKGKKPYSSTPFKTSELYTEDDVFRFLSAFKTELCIKAEHHEWKCCPKYHTFIDQRRNPYEHPFAVDDAKNGVEKAYHPTNFRTLLCDEYRSTRRCIRGSFCAKAHCESQLRDVRSAQDVYYSFLDTAATRVSTVHDFIVSKPSKLESSPSLPYETGQWDIPCKQCTFQNCFLAVECQVCGTMIEPELRKVTEEYLLTDLEKHFILPLEHQDKFSRALASKFLISLSWTRIAIQLTGSPANVAECIESLQGEKALESYLLEQHLVRISSTCYGKRALAEVPADVVPDDMFLIRHENNFEVLGLRRFGTKPLKKSLGLIDNWIRANKLNELKSCCICYDDELTHSEVIFCSQGEHSLCVTCTSTYIDTQVSQLQQQQEDNLACPLCDPPCNIDNQEVAAKVPKSVFRKLNMAQVDFYVSKKQREFEQQLKAKVDELHRQYDANTSEVIKSRAKDFAHEYRNLILNLCCPHCKQVYGEFDGCMAIQCAVCKGFFCGWCHRASETSRAAHQHVRDCEHNLCGDYWASSDKLVEGQREYRRRALRKKLQEHKKDLRNAIVIELREDLRSLGLDVNQFYMDMGNA